MSNSHQHLIRKIHASPLRLVIAVTGGGSLVISDLLTEPGASDTVLEAFVPYGEAALCDLLGHKPEQSCSEKTARRMAMAAFTRARSQTLATPHKQLIGVGCTCSLASDRPKRGEHRAHWAVQSGFQTLVASVVFEKDARSRLEEERLVADLLIKTIDAYASAASHLYVYQLVETDALTIYLQRLLRPNEKVLLRVEFAGLEVRDVLFGDRDACCIIPKNWPNVLPDDQNMQPNAGTPAKQHFLFPGSFDPMHRGHCRMMQIVREKYPDVPIALEIAVRNVDKPPVDYIDLYDRFTSIAQTPGKDGVPVWLTRFPRFADKSDFFRGVTFVVGTDTLKRIATGLYYQDAIASTQAAVERLTGNGCRFLCYARRNADGELETAETLDLPDSLRHIVDFVPVSEFCDDISSTQLRKNQG